MLIYIYRYTVESDLKRMITMPFVAILAAGAGSILENNFTYLLVNISALTNEDLPRF